MTARPEGRTAGREADVERWEIPLRDVQLSQEERQRLLNRHVRRDTRTVTVWDEAIGAEVERDVPLPTPLCWTCREPWGEYGCSTYRAVVLLGILDRETRKATRRIEELTEALTPSFAVDMRRRVQRDVVELRMQIDQHVLLYGMMGAVDATLGKMRDYWRDWFKKVGDLARIHEDHAHALTLDSDYYTYLTQAFDPSDLNFTKAAGAPWPALSSRPSAPEDGQ